MFNDFPNLHPLVVHFPIVLLLIAVVLQLALIFKDSQVLRIVTLTVMGGGFLGAVLASYIFHAHTAELSPTISEVFERHEKFANYTVWLSGVALLLQSISFFYKLPHLSFRLLVFVFTAITALFVSLAGHQGARLVYVEGVGPKGAGLMKGHSHSGSESDSEHDMGNMEQSTGHQHSDTANGMGGMNHDNMNMDSHESMGGMDHGNMDMREGSSTSGMKGMDHSKMNMSKGNKSASMKGMDHSNMNMGSGSKPAPMQGMDHGNMNMSQGNKSSNMQGMNHGNMNMGAGDKTSGMKGMDHGNMNMGQGNKSNDMQGMDHGNMEMGQGNKATNMQGMEHGNMDMSSGGSMPGMNHGDMAGGNQPLIDPTPAYDNNPASEEKRVKQKQ